MARWNPYNITHYSNRFLPGLDMRNGGMTPETAFNGSSSTIFYRTPTQFFDVRPSSSSDCSTLGFSVYDDRVRFP